MGAHDDDVFMRMRAWPGLRPVPLQTLQTSLCSAPPQAPRQSWRQLLLWLASHLPQRSSLLSPKERFAQSTHALLPGEGVGAHGTGQRFCVLGLFFKCNTCTYTYWAPYTEGTRIC